MFKESIFHLNIFLQENMSALTQTCDRMVEEVSTILCHTDKVHRIV